MSNSTVVTENADGTLTVTVWGESRTFPTSQVISWEGKTERSSSYRRFSYRRSSYRRSSHRRSSFGAACVYPAGGEVHRGSTRAWCSPETGWTPSATLCKNRNNPRLIAFRDTYASDEKTSRASPGTPPTSTPPGADPLTGLPEPHFRDGGQHVCTQSLEGQLRTAAG